LGIEDIVETLSDEECRELLLKGCRTFAIDEVSVQGIVKKAIDEFDPYGIGPRSGGPYDEYEPEILAISERIQEDLSSLDIAKIIEEVFIKYFDAEFDFFRYERTADKIFYYLKRYYYKR